MDLIICCQHPIFSLFYPLFLVPSFSLKQFRSAETTNEGACFIDVQWQGTQLNRGRGRESLFQRRKSHIKKCGKKWNELFNCESSCWFVYLFYRSMNLIIQWVYLKSFLIINRYESLNITVKFMPNLNIYFSRDMWTISWI